MIIETEAKLILTIKNPKKGEVISSILLRAENCINTKIKTFTMPETKTKIDIRIEIDEGELTS